VRIGNPAFPQASIYSAKEMPIATEAPVELVSTSPGDMISYEDVLYKVPNLYIVGEEKFPLEGVLKKYQKIREGDESGRGVPKLSMPQVGLLPAQLNKYFLQESVELVSRTFNPQKLKGGAQGFLRIGVENDSRHTNDSFLAACAPFFGQNSTKKMKQLLAEIIQPRIFMNINHGNLLLEMYDSAGIRPKVSEELKKWARLNLGIRKITTNNEEIVIRAYMAYNQFQTWLDSETTLKEYRHFAHLFTQPGFLQTATRRIAESGAAITEYRRPGVLFIVIDVLKSGEYKVRCPPYPINKDLFTKSDIGFLFRHYSGIWEPIFYVDNRPPGERDLNSYFLLFSNGHYSKWPKIVQQRVEEFANQCAVPRTGGRGYYTSISGVPSTKIVGVTALKQQLAKEESLIYYGLIRDSYNHVAGLVYKMESSGLVAIPVVDDGLSVGDTHGVLILDWDDFEPAPLVQVVGFYRKYIEPRFPNHYTIQRAVKSRGTGQIEAVQLKNNLYVPVGAGISEGIHIEFPDPMSPIEISEMEWSINHKIAMSKGDESPPGDETRIAMKEFNEVYEHLRLTFSNWLNSQEDGGELRNILDTTIYRRDIPLFEKRKRLEILLFPHIESWISESDEDTPFQASLLRVDCRLRPESECAGACAWSQEKGQCLIHVPPGDEGASGGYVLTLRLIEELLRYGGKRKELFEQRVSRLAYLDKPIKSGDQYIIPEKSAAWTELLLLEWSKYVPERARYLEEMHKEPVLETAPTEPPNEISSLPDTLETLLGKEDPHTQNLKLYPSPTGKIAPFLSLFQINEAEIGLEPDATELTDTAISSLLRKTKMPIVQIDLRVNPPIILAKQAQRDKGLGYPVFIIRDNVPISLLATNTETPVPLQAEECPAALKEIVKNAVKIFIKMV